MKITINGKQKHELEINSGTVLDAIRLTNEIFVSPCGGNHKCNNCKVLIEQNNASRVVFACSTPLEDGMVINLRDVSQNNETKHTACSEANCCVDIGTTTLVYSILDLDNNIVEEYSVLNPQMRFGNDVMTRIKYGSENGSASLSNILKENMVSFFKSHSSTTFNNLFISGNTTMLHLFLDVDVSSLGTYPFTPKFLEQKFYKGEDLNLPVKNTYILPSISSFVGADIVSGIYYSNLLNGNNLLVDIGTNGEMALSYGGKLYVTSTAAGPAFEGSCVECGTNAVPGAINRVYLDNGLIKFSTIKDISPCGITGSGLIDTISILKDKGIIDETGLLHSENKKYYLTDTIYISQKDIRNFQYAKGAIYTGIKLLVEHLNIPLSEIEKVYIAGSLGEHISLDACMNIHLLPIEFKGKYEVIGNSSLKGLIKYASNYQKEAFDFVQNAANLSLNESPEFMEEFVNNLEL